MFRQAWLVGTIAVASVFLSAACGNEHAAKSEALIVSGERECPTASDARPVLEGLGAQLGERSTMVRVVGLYATKRMRAPSKLCWYRLTGSGEGCSGDQTRESVMQRINPDTVVSWFRQEWSAVDEVAACDDGGRLRGYRIPATACPDGAPVSEEVRTDLGISTFVGSDEVQAQTACFYRTLRQPCEATALGNNAGYCVDDLDPEDVPSE